MPTYEDMLWPFESGAIWVNGQLVSLRDIPDVVIDDTTASDNFYLHECNYIANTFSIDISTNRLWRRFRRLTRRLKQQTKRARLKEKKQKDARFRGWAAKNNAMEEV